MVLDEVKKLGAAPIPPTEFAARKASLTGNYGRAIDTSAGMAGVLTSDALYGVDLREVGLYTRKVNAVTAAEAEAAAPAAVDPASASVIVVGDAKQFLAPLKARFPNVEVIPAAAFDPDSPTLTHQP